MAINRRRVFTAFRKFRDGLNNNKIFFEIIVATTLSFMAIYVSIQANRIAETQTKIMEQENLPQLEVRLSQEYDPGIKMYDNDIWYFYNRGGKLTDFEREDISFLEFLYQPNYDTIVIPLYNYTNMRGTLTGDGDDLVFYFDNNHNGVKENQLRDSLRQYGFFDINTFVVISYNDIFDQEHTEYYQLSPGVSRVSKERWDEVSSYFKNKDKHTFQKLYAAEIINKMNKNER